MIRGIVVTVAALVMTALAVTPASAQPLLFPASCAEIRAALPIAGNGNYLLHTSSRLVPVYCHDMAGTPREYVTLGAVNFSQYTAGGAAPGVNVRTTFTRLRIDPETLTVDVNDLTFATSTGTVTQSGSGGTFVITSMAYGVAASCDGAPSGVGRVDLGGTAFVLDDTFQLGGFMPSGGAAVSPDNRGADLTGGGFCGGITPAPYIFDPTNPSTPDFHLELACGPYTVTDALLGRACVDLA
jgi:hypothetical protein